jgi:hypothetical protein
MSGDASSPSKALLPSVARQLVLLPLIVVLGPLSTGLRFSWRWLLHSYVEEYDSYGLGLAVLGLSGVGAGLLVWVICWFLLRRRRALLVGQLVAVLIVPIVVSAGSIDEALSNPAGDHEAQVAQQAAADRAAALGVVAYWQDLPAWLDRLPGGATPWFPSVADGHGITWRGTVFPPPGTTPNVSEPLRRRQIVVVSGSPTDLLVLTEHGEDGSGVLELVDIALHGPNKVVADAVTGAAAAPDGHGYAYSTDRMVIARREGAAEPVVLPRAGLVLRGWGSDGVVLQEADGTLLRWQPEHPDRAPATLVISTGAVMVPPRGHRMLQRACLQPYDAVGATAAGQPEPYVGFNGGVWPVTLPVQVGSNSQPCQHLGQQNVLTAAGTIERPGQQALALSPDGRYLLLAGLQVLDLDSGTRTSLVDAGTRDMFLTIEKGFLADPIGTGFWQDDRTVEITAGGSPVAVCALPTGPCRSTGQVLPRRP